MIGEEHGGRLMTAAATLLVCAAVVASGVLGAAAADVGSSDRRGIAVDMGGHPGGAAGDPGSGPADAGDAPANAQIKAARGIDSCGVVDEPGSYELTEDIGTGGGEACLHVRASNVTIDGNGHTVAGSGAEGSVGLLVYNGTLDGEYGEPSLRNVTVRNLTVTGWERGAQVGAIDGDGTRARLVDVTATGNTNMGIYLVETENVALRDVTASRNRYGLVLWETYGLTASGVTAADNEQRGLSLSQNVGDSVLSDVLVTGNGANCSGCSAVYLSTDVENNTITDSRIVDNEAAGVAFTDSSGNVVRDTVIAGNAGPGVVGNPTDDRIANVTVRGNDAPAVSVRRGTLRVDRATIGDAYRVTLDGAAEVGFGDGDPFALDAVDADGLPGEPPGAPAASEGLAVTGAPAPLSVSVRLNGSVDPAAVDLWRYDGSTWTRVDGATVEDGRIVGTVNASGIVVPLASADETNGTGEPGGTDSASGTDGSSGTEDAADGTDGGATAGDGGTAEDGGAADAAASESTLVVRSTADEPVGYTIVVDGDASRTSTADAAADAGDSIVENDDGTVTIDGTTADGAGDAFAIAGEVVAVEFGGVGAGYRVVVAVEDSTDGTS